MGFFSSKSVSYLGVDLGLGGIKLVELKDNKGRAQLLTYGYSEEMAEVSYADYFANTDRLATTIKKICQKAKTTSKEVITSLPTYMVFDSIITLPVMSNKELKKAVWLEAQKLISRPLSEMQIYWNVLNQENNNQKSTLISDQSQGSTTDQGRDIIVTKDTKYLKILITAAPKEVINKYVEIFHKAGLKLNSVDTNSFALTRSLVGKDRSQIMVVDIGAGSAEVVIINQGLPVFSRSVDIGGYKFTAALKKIFGLDWLASEQSKIDLGHQAGTSIINNDLITRELAPIINEIKHSLNLYANRMAVLHPETKVDNPEKLINIEKLILTGGSSLLFGLGDYLKQELKLRVFIGDPWARVIYPQDLKSTLDDIGPKFAVAIGLAMRDIIK